MKKINIVVPCFNEEEVLPSTAEKLLQLLQRLVSSNKVSKESSIIFVDDGSSDNTWHIIDELARDNPIVGLKLSCNKGHQNALLAGVHYEDCDAVISIDADLQDDHNAIEDMVDQFNSGIDIVYGVRKSRQADSWFKRISAESYYGLLRRLGVDIVFNHADFRLTSRRVIQALEQHKEVNMFLRGIVPSIGYSSTTVSYDRTERMAGESKYPLGKMLSFALKGITSHTSFPLRLIAFIGIIIFCSTTLLSFWVLWVALTSDDAVPGWASSVLPIYFLGGVQLLSIGILGEYIGNIYMETKQRPRYIIEKTTKE